MTPQQKANELIDKFIQHSECFTPKLELSAKTGVNNAIQCALICTDELIKYLPSSAGNPPNIQESESNKEWWQKVKNEINKQFM
jgi:hypothetical protein